MLCFSKTGRLGGGDTGRVGQRSLSSEGPSKKPRSFFEAFFLCFQQPWQRLKRRTMQVEARTEDWPSLDEEARDCA